MLKSLLGKQIDGLKILSQRLTFIADNSYSELHEYSCMQKTSVELNMKIDFCFVLVVR